MKKFLLSDYDIQVTLGTGCSCFYSGSFGRVRLAKHKGTGKYFALKMLKKAEIIKSKQVDHVLNENTILNMIKHPFIVTHSLI
jgi:serine/threonine protein kinase